MRKVEKIIEIKEDVKIGDVILEAGDKIEIVESGTRYNDFTKMTAPPMVGDTYQGDPITHVDGDFFVSMKQEGYKTYWYLWKAGLQSNFTTQALDMTSNAMSVSDMIARRKNIKYGINTNR